MALRNVLIDSNGNMMICDFGLSKVMHTGKDGNVYASHAQGTDVPFQMYVWSVGVYDRGVGNLLVYDLFDMDGVCVVCAWWQVGSRNPRNGSLHGKNRCA